MRAVPALLSLWPALCCAFWLCSPVLFAVLAFWTLWRGLSCLRAVCFAVLLAFWAVPLVLRGLLGLLGAGGGLDALLMVAQGAPQLLVLASVLVGLDAQAVQLTAHQRSEDLARRVGSEVWPLTG